MAQPQQAVTPPLSTPQATPGLMRRMASWCYEGMVLFAVVFIPAYFFGVLTNTRHALHNRTALQVLLLLVLVVYFVWFWRRGSTLPMKTWRMGVVDVQGKALSRGLALRRLACCQIWFLPLYGQALLTQVGFAGMSLFQVLLAQALWPIFWAFSARWQREHQFWHDIWAHTRLVERAAPTAQQPPPSYDAKTANT